MGRLTNQTRAQKEATIRAAMGRLLRGEIPPGGKCDVKTLAAVSGVTRAALYSTYVHLKEESNDGAINFARPAPIHATPRSTGSRNTSATSRSDCQPPNRRTRT